MGTDKAVAFTNVFDDLVGLIFKAVGFLFRRRVCRQTRSESGADQEKKKGDDKRSVKTKITDQGTAESSA